MDLHRIVYSSRPFGYDAADLSAILLDARRLNARDGITGALICRQDLFLQLLEGPSDPVAATLGRIRRDDRHVEVVLRLSEDAPTRMFGDWAMLHDPAQSVMWSPAEIAAGVLDRVDPSEIRSVFGALNQPHAV